MTMEKKDYMQESYIWEVFRHFDVKNTGKITKDDLAVVLTSGESKDFESALEVEKTEIEDTMKSADLDADGELDFDDFMELMRKSYASPLGRSTRTARTTRSMGLDDSLNSNTGDDKRKSRVSQGLTRLKKMVTFDKSPKKVVTGPGKR